MNASKFKKNTKTGKSTEPVHQNTMDGSSHMKGISPTLKGPFSSFYSAGPILSLKPIVQAKLTIGQPNDRYEREADRVADQVMRMPESQGALVNGHLSLVQRQSACSECPEKEEEEEPVQAKQLSGKSSQVTPGFPNRIHSLRGGGQPLPKSLRNFFEPRFGADFSGVRVHTCSKAIETAKSINSKAFTTGKDVVFGPGQYSPGTSTGKHLLAHELTHVIQQSGSKIKSAFISRHITENHNFKIQRWEEKGDERICDSNSDTLEGLSWELTESESNWPCIKPVSMKSKKATGKDYYKNLTIGDKFNVSNLTSTTGPPVNYRVVESGSGTYEQAIATHYRGDYKDDPKASIEDAAFYGGTPIQELILSGHTEGTTIWGDNAEWDVGKENPDNPEPSKEDAEIGMFPQRCWFTPNAQVRIVGCCSEKVASPFADAFLRKDAQVTGAKEGICGHEKTYIQPPEIYMTFESSCDPDCPIPEPGVTTYYSADDMNDEPDKWTTIKGKL
jgi:hypothetical protein